MVFKLSSSLEETNVHEHGVAAVSVFLYCLVRTKCGRWLRQFRLSNSLFMEANSNSSSSSPSRPVVLRLSNASFVSPFAQPVWKTLLVSLRMSLAYNFVTSLLWMRPRASHTLRPTLVCRHVRTAQRTPSHHQLCTLQCMTVPVVVRAFFSDRTQLAKRILVMAQFIFTIAWG